MQLQVMNSPFDQKQIELLNELLHNLSDNQRIWLSGYLSATSFSGQIAATPASSTTVQSQEAKEVTVLYGTQTGNAQQLAETFTEQLKAKGFEVTTQDMSDFRPNNLKKIKNLLIIISTHGEGDPPDNAMQFYEFLFSRRAPKLKQLNFSVLALGDSSYEHFCLTGKEIDERLEQLGGTRFASRVDCDVDFDEPAEKWFGNVAEALEESSSTEAVAQSAPGNEKVTSLYSRTNPFAAEVLENINLNGRGSNKETRHIELLIEGSNLKFEPGDSIGIYPKNDVQLVDTLLQTANWNADETMTLKDKEISLKDTLLHHVEITVLTRPLLEKIANTFKNEALRDMLQEENVALLKDYIENYDLLDLIKDFELKDISAAELIPLLRKLAPRLYSVASSYKANSDEVHLTIGAVRYFSGGRERKGVCSTYCAENVEPGDTLHIYVQRNQNFRLPENPETPIIMIGPGTGVAPFRSFLEEREEIDATGKSWLFFGDQHYVTDFLYQVDWQRWLESGVLTRMDVAFSRDTDKKVYVQHRMLKKKAELYAWLEEGAVVYVCGDEKNMAKDVHDTLIEIVRTEGGLSSEDAEAYVKQLQRDKRYQRDVY